MMSSSKSNCRRFEGKVAVITGSTEGIGFAIAERLAEEGACVAVSSRKQENVDKAVASLKAKGHKVIGVKCHVAKKEDRLALLEQTETAFGGIDILVSNAATNPAMGPVLNVTEPVWDKIFDVNLKSTFFLVKETVPYIQKRGGGSVILVSSTSGYNPRDVIGIYGVSKTALLGLTKALAPQLAQDNIRVNCLVPGLVKTKLSTALWTNDAILDATLSKQSIHRIGIPSEMGGVVAFLTSDDASYMTGEAVVVSGGVPSRL